jgi:hypothetical protein
MVTIFTIAITPRTEFVLEVDSFGFMAFAATVCGTFPRVSGGQRLVTTPTFWIAVEPV